MALTLSFPEGSALVAGGTGNVGMGVVRRMAQADVPTVFTYRGSAEKAAALEKELRDTGHRVWARQMDMCDSASIDSAISFAEEMGGPLHTLLAPAGAPVPFNRISDFTPEEVEAFVRGDGLAFYRLTNRVVKAMRARGGGRIVLCSTMAVRRVIDFDGISPMSKGMVDALIRQVAAEEGRNGIRCNGVAIGVSMAAKVEDVAAMLPPDPGPETEDPMGMYAHLFARVTAMPRLGRVATPEEAGDLFVFLASNQANYVTGQIVAIDGGSTL